MIKLSYNHFQNVKTRQISTAYKYKVKGVKLLDTRIKSSLIAKQFYTYMGPYYRGFNYSSTEN